MQSAGILSGGSDVTDVIGFQQLIAAMFKASPDFAVILLGVYFLVNGRNAELRGKDAEIAARNWRIKEDEQLYSARLQQKADELDHVRDRLAAVTAERDLARDRLAAVTAERDLARVKLLETVTAERDRLQQQLRSTVAVDVVTSALDTAATRTREKAKFRVVGSPS